VAQKVGRGIALLLHDRGTRRGECTEFNRNFPSGLEFVCRRIDGFHDQKKKYVFRFCLQNGPKIAFQFFKHFPSSNST